jgi:phage replication O-like protein O
MINTTQVPNELLEDIFLGKYSLREAKILLFIVRKTIGWQRETEWLQNDYIAKSIGMDKSHVSRTVKQLIKKGVLEIFEVDGKRYVGLLLLPKEQPPVAKKATEQLPKEQPLKETNILKETIIKYIFKKPTIEEVRSYCQERKNNVDPELFYDFYESKGWKVGNAPMKNWKACVRTWEKGRQRFTDNKKPANVLNQNSGIDYALAWKNKNA